MPGLNSGTSGAGVTAFGGTFNIVRVNGMVGWQDGAHDLRAVVPAARGGVPTARH